MIDTRIVRSADLKDGMFVPQPGDQFVQLITENGAFLYKDCQFYTAIVKAEKPVELAEMTQHCKLKVPKIPLELFMQIEDFFDQVYTKHKSEAVVLLYVSPAKRAWQAMVPTQTVTGASVSYDLKQMPMKFAVDDVDFFLFGSIHSHGSMPAFHSGTDDDDEAHFDGLHVTIGNIPTESKSYSTRYMIHGSAFGKLKLEDAVDIPTTPRVECEKAWLEKVSEKTYPVTQYQGRGGAWGTGSPMASDSGKVQGATTQPAAATNQTSSKETSTKDGTAQGGQEPTGNANTSRRRTRGKDWWKRRAQLEHCYTCTCYIGNSKCSVRAGTTPYSTCVDYELNPNISEKLMQEAHDYLRVASTTPQEGGSNGTPRA